nr:hypothetical protein [Nitrospira moscoviensis]
MFFFQTYRAPNSAARSSHPVAPAGVGVYNPAFDVIPAELITAIITERGVFKPGELAALAY